MALKVADALPVANRRYSGVPLRATGQRGRPEVAPIGNRLCRGLAVRWAVESEFVPHNDVDHQMGPRVCGRIIKLRAVST